MSKDKQFQDKEEPYLCGGRTDDWAGIDAKIRRIFREEQKLNAEKIKEKK